MSDKRQPIQHRLQITQVWPVSNLKWMGELLVIPSNIFYLLGSRYLQINKPKGLKVAKEDQKADRHDGH